MVSSLVMSNYFSKLETSTKAVLIIGIVIVGYTGWYLISPLFIEGPTGESTFDPNATVLSSGNFERMDDAHWATGVGQIVSLPDGMGLANLNN